MFTSSSTTRTRSGDPSARVSSMPVIVSRLAVRFLWTACVGLTTSSSPVHRIRTAASRRLLLMTEPEFETPPPPPTAPPMAPPPPPAQPRPRFRDPSVGLLPLVVAPAAARVIGGTLGAATGGLVGFAVGHHDLPDGPAMVRMHWPEGSEGGPRFAP